MADEAQALQMPGDAAAEPAATVAPTPELGPEQPRPERPARRRSLRNIPPEVRLAHHFPAAPRSSTRGGTIHDEKFFAYWYALPADVAGRQLVYIQRLWPVLNYALLMTPEQAATFDRVYPHQTRKPNDIEVYLRKIGIFKYIDKFIQPFETKDWRTEILRRYGSGDYKLYLNDTGVPGNPNLPQSTICTTITKLRDDQYPPVLDLNILDMFDPANASFIQDRRLRGLTLPGDEEIARERKQTEEEDMSAVTQQVLEANDRLTRQVVEMASKPKEETKPVPAQTAPDVAALASANEKALGVLADAAKRAVEASAQANNPQMYMENVLKAAERLAGDRKQDSGGNGTEMLKLMMQMQADNHKALLDMQEKAYQAQLAAMTERLSSLERRLEDKAQANGGSPMVAGPGGQPMTLRNLVKEYQEVKKLFSDEEGETPGEGGVLGVIERLGTKALDALPDFMDNLEKLKANQPISEPAAQAAPAPKKVESPEVIKERMMAENIRPYLDEAVAKYHGYEFAGNVIASFSMGVYQDFTRDGETGLTGFLMRNGLHQPLVAKHGAQKVGTFITEFLDEPRAQIVAAEIRQRNAKPPASNGAPPVNTGPKVNPPRAQ